MLKETENNAAISAKLSHFSQRTRTRKINLGVVLSTKQSGSQYILVDPLNHVQRAPNSWISAATVVSCFCIDFRIVGFGPVRIGQEKLPYSSLFADSMLLACAVSQG